MTLTQDYLPGTIATASNTWIFSRIRMIADMRQSQVQMTLAMLGNVWMTLHGNFASIDLGFAAVKPLIESRSAFRTHGFSFATENPTSGRELEPVAF